MKPEKKKNGLAGGMAARCMGCRHYYVTWEPAHPHGCRAYGFKSRRVPRDVVLDSSGEDCRLFQPAAS